MVFGNCSIKFQLSTHLKLKKGSDYMAIFPFSYDITLDINNTQTINYPNIEFTQGDTEAYKINIFLKANGSPINLAGRTISITFRKSDGNTVTGNCTISSAENGECFYILGTTEVQVAGRLLATVEVYESTSRITTNRFAVSVIEQLDNGSAIESTTEYPILTSLIADAQEVVNETTGAISALDSRVETIENQDLEAELIAHKAEKATKEVLGHVKVDGLSIVADVDGVISTASDKTFVYKEGDEFSSATGGWVEAEQVGDYQLSKELNYLNMITTTAGVHYAGYRTGIHINVDNISTIYMDAEVVGNSGSRSTLALTATTGNYPGATYEATLTVAGEYARTIKSLDVSGATGDYFVRLLGRNATGGGTDFKVYKVWGEE